MDEIPEYSDQEKISNLNISFDSDDLNNISIDTARNYELNIECELNSKSAASENSIENFVNKSNEFPDLLLQQ